MKRNFAIVHELSNIAVDTFVGDGRVARIERVVLLVYKHRLANQDRESVVLSLPRSGKVLIFVIVEIVFVYARSIAYNCVSIALPHIKANLDVLRIDDNIIINLENGVCGHLLR